jgi:DNA primase small subunit
MPHSLSPDNSGTSSEDAMATDLEAVKGEVQAADEAELNDTQTLNNDSQESDAVDQDMTMVEVGQDVEIPEPVVKEEIKSEVKLEDLFADVESDEEFPSSTGLDIKVSSSPQAPASPM